MDQRERWQALQSHLGAARALFDAGDRTRALGQVDAALAIDPDFLAALSLRERILTAPLPAPPPVAAASVAADVDSGPLAADLELRPAPVDVVDVVDVEPPRIADAAVVHVEPAPLADAAVVDFEPPPGAEPAAVEFRPLVSTEGYARFEERAKRRRVDRRVDAARAAITRRRIKDAAAALDEIRELDPNLPELVTLAAELAELRRTRTRSHGGPWLAAAATFAIGVLGATWLQESGRLASHPIVPQAPAPLVASAPSDVIGTTGTDSGVADAPTAAPADVIDVAVAAPDTNREVIDRRQPEPIAPPPSTRSVEPQTMTPPVARAALTPSQIAAPAPPPMPQPLASPTLQQPLASPALRQPVAPAPAPPVTAAAATPAPVVPNVVPADRVLPMPTPTADDDRLVRDALQRYRAAYEDLDAHSAQAVWPAVNQVALARAFDGLESQSLTFESCNVQLRGESASATCRGTARYVPKVGSREPHVEPRVWNFTLRKNEGDWKIDSARAQR